MKQKYPLTRSYAAALKATPIPWWQSWGHFREWRRCRWQAFCVLLALRSLTLTRLLGGPIWSEAVAFAKSRAWNLRQSDAAVTEFTDLLTALGCDAWARLFFAARSSDWAVERIRALCLPQANTYIAEQDIPRPRPSKHMPGTCSEVSLPGFIYLPSCSVCGGIGRLEADPCICCSGTGVRGAAARLAEWEASKSTQAPADMSEEDES